MLFKKHAIHHARSAGTSDKARTKVNQKLIDWADIIFVMERRHKELLSQRQALSISGKQIVILEIEDLYVYGDAELVEILRKALAAYL
jgi:predicted protein tyrosine phosphatase